MSITPSINEAFEGLEGCGIITLQPHNTQRKEWAVIHLTVMEYRTKESKETIRKGQQRSLVDRVLVQDA